MSGSLKIVSRGLGPELVLLHGWAMHSGIWGGVIDALATEFRVHLVDLPGHGLNRHIALLPDLDSVAALILSRVPPAIWIGWSLGGLVAMSAAIRQPDKFRKLVLVGATPSFSKQENWGWGANIAIRQAFSDGLDDDPGGALDKFYLQAFGAGWTANALQRLATSESVEKSPGVRDLKSGLNLLFDNNLLADLPTCSVPTLFLGGSRDRTVNPESFNRAAALMPDARACIIPGAGHAPFISHEDQFLKIVWEFLRGGQTR